MSDLQASLVVIGAVLIVAVCAVNWVQERGLRRRLQRSFQAHDDVLLRAVPEASEATLADGRLEPQLSTGRAREEPQAVEAGPERYGVEAGTPVDETLDYVVELEADAPVPDTAVAELATRAAAFGRPVQMAGLDAGSGRWEDAARGAAGRYFRLRLGLQLVTRSGALDAAQLANFCDTVRSVAGRLGARVTCPDAPSALKRSRELDEFCAQVDVAIGLNVVADDERSFPGATIRAGAEQAGFRLESDGVFHFRDETHHTLFTLDNHEPAPFLPESIQGIATRGVTLLLDVPRARAPVAALDLMLDAGRYLAEALGGVLVDDNRAALTDAGIARIREQIRSIQSSMESRGIPAGSEKALRLFA